jgi:hypothetical protein
MGGKPKKGKDRPIKTATVSPKKAEATGAANPEAGKTVTSVKAE